MNRKSKTIQLFYWSSINFEGKQKENYGDLLSRYLVEKISGKAVSWVHPKKQPWYKRNKNHYLAIGSILAQASKNSIVWGSGIIDKEHSVAKADFRAVRGPQTRKFLLNLGYDCPKIYGDPALVLPEYFNPQVKKNFKIGIVPHYVDYPQVEQWYSNDEDVQIVDLLTDDVETTTTEILECDYIISSSLHGIIVAHAYGIPALWVEFSNKIFGDGVKYADYFESVGLKVYNPKNINFFLSNDDLLELVKREGSRPQANEVKLLQRELMNSCPFKN